MTSTGTAILYVCTARTRTNGDIAAKRALEEGRAYAEKNHLTIIEEISDSITVTMPHDRDGWSRIRELAEGQQISHVITRWPNAIANDPGIRTAEISHLRSEGVAVRFTWAPLIAANAQPG